MEEENRVNRLKVQRLESRRKTRDIQGSWVPYALPAICFDISLAEAQLGQVHATDPVTNVKRIKYILLSKGDVLSLYT